MKRKWWHDKVAYQIYPKSFFDSNGDGIGDIPGIISKLDYLKELGVDIVWISPCYPSPMADQGYDISDYYNIHPAFGTLDDMDRLLTEARKRDMYILLDLVVNHCSDEHEWFEKACADPDGKYGNFFYIEDKKEGQLPCNWRSYFGGSVWEPLPGHPDKQYLHLFHKKQPDLNWENPCSRLIYPSHRLCPDRRLLKSAMHFLFHLLSQFHNNQILHWRSFSVHASYRLPYQSCSSYHSPPVPYSVYVL